MIRIISNEDAVTMSNADKISDTLAVAPEAGTDATEGAAIGDAKKQELTHSTKGASARDRAADHFAHARPERHAGHRGG